jgi:hypothetical protein
MSATFLHYHTGQPGGSLVGAPRLKEVGCLPAYLILKVGCLPNLFLRGVTDQLLPLNPNKSRIPAAGVSAPCRLNKTQQSNLLLLLPLSAR